MKKALKIIAATLTICWVASEVISVIEYITGKRGWNKSHKPYSIYERLIKRPLDIFVSLVALLLLWPVMAIVALLVRIKLGSPVLFVQERPGLDEKIFKLYKFRTMTDERDEDGNLLPDEIRLTSFGKWLRSTSLDELPELLNVIKGDMSIVGPRPLLVRYIPYYYEKELHRHDVRPGITGLAQVHGRNYVNWDRRIEYDIEYVRDISFIGDLKIIIKTIWMVFARDGVAQNADDAELCFDDYRKLNSVKKTDNPKDN